ncbi:hypothetical protein BGZ60DRAFT_387600 [Tricladium varicosporioides]|nr:hypothetical protein BGZ60DRAFT_387600 [Hymenoscyphus varicosporioides]
MASALPTPRLVVTTHTEDGTSTFLSDQMVPAFAPFGPSAASFSRFHSRLSVPVSNTTSPPEMPLQLPRCPPHGIIFCTSDFPPGASSPMHRTLSLDYCVVMSGEIVLKTDSGEEKTVKAGEFIVQRGVNHLWENKGSETCRIAFVMVSAEKIVLKNGAALEETVIPPKKP